EYAGRRDHRARTPSAGRVNLPLTDSAPTDYAAWLASVMDPFTRAISVFRRRNIASMKRALIALFGVATVLAACGGNTSATTPSAGGTAVPTPPAASLTGAGATFPQPFYAAAFFAYNKRFSQVTVNYQSVGSGAGIQQLTKKTVDFGASDVPMSSTELAAAGGADNVVQIATTLGTESLAYNLSGVSNGQLKLTPDTIAGIFLGKIKKWNDPALAGDNSGVSL